MPELPEVETVKNALQPQLAGRSIVEVTLLRAEVVAHPTAARFTAQACGKKILRVERRGKFLCLVLEEGTRIVLHLRMTGQLLAAPAALPMQKHTHVILQLDDGRQLRFADPRRFGRFWLLEAGEEDCYSGIQKLGIEPFDACLSGSWLAAQLGKRKKPIKECLLEQHIVAGIGNIYGDEILFAAGINPLCSASLLQEAQWARLAEAIPQVLQEAIRQNAVTPAQYLADGGLNYRNTSYFQVYGRAGQPCPRCAQTLVRAVLSGRSSVYCPCCQPMGQGKKTAALQESDKLPPKK